MPSKGSRLFLEKKGANIVIRGASDGYLDGTYKKGDATCSEEKAAKLRKNAEDKKESDALLKSRKSKNAFK